MRDPIEQATERIRAALRSAQNPCVTTGFQLGGLVLIHLIRSTGADVPVILIDSGYLPEATVDFGRRIASKWALDLRIVTPDEEVIDFETRHGGPLYLTDPDRCCRQRRVAPGHSALAEYGLWFTALRRSQSATRRDLAWSSVVVLGNGTAIDRVTPLLDWTWSEITEYADANSVPRHPLYEAGYTSIGCAPCTMPTWASEDDRTGRWDGEKTECGLHSVMATPVEIQAAGPALTGSGATVS